MSQELSLIDYQKPVYLHYMFEKFYEIRLDNKTNKALVRQGNLMSNGQENILSVQTGEQSHLTWEEACRYTDTQVKAFVSNGYQRLENHSPQKFDIPMAYSVIGFQPGSQMSQSKNNLSGSGSSRSRLKRRREDVLPRDDAKSMKFMESSQNSVALEESANLNIEAKGESGGFWSFVRKILPIGQGDKNNQKKTIELSDQLLEHINDIEQKCDELRVDCKLNENKITVSGNVEAIEKLEQYITQLEESLSSQEEREESEDDNKIRKDIMLSPFLETMIDHITKKAQHLNIHYALNGRNLTVLGQEQDIMELLMYLVELEAMPSKQKVDKKEFEEFVKKEAEVNKSINSILFDIKKKVETMDLRMKVTSEEFIQQEVRLTQNMNESLTGIKSKVEAIEVSKVRDSKELRDEENKRVQTITTHLNEMKRKMESLEAKIEENRSGLGQKELDLLKLMNDNLKEIRKKVDELEFKMELNADEVIQEDLKIHQAMNETLGAIVKKIDGIDVKVDINSGDFVQKEVRMKGIQDSLADMSKKISALEQKIDNSSKRPSGASDLDKKFEELRNFIDKRLNIQAAGDIIGNSQISASQKKLVTPSGNEEPANLTQKEIGISAFHKSCIEDIKKKAAELELFLDFGYDILLATGNLTNIDKFIVYLHECELKVKKTLYPKHWDRFENRQFSLINVPSGTEEFKEIAALFENTTLQYRPIIKIERIQNKYLMEHYISHIQQRKLEKLDNSLQRKFLFNVTGQANPEVIYKQSDVGFDVQYGENKGYGKALYFTSQPGNNVPFQVYKTSLGTFQTLIADVLIGKPKVHNEGARNYTKAPDGYDSVSINGTTYAIFNNFHSYPLYLVEYC